MSAAAAESNIATLLVSCADRKGIVAALAQLLYGHGANILSADQYTDTEVGQFFQRIRFDVSDALTDRVAIRTAIEEVAGRLGMTFRLSYGDRIPKAAIFVSKLDHCLYDLLWRHRVGELRCEIKTVIANHADLEPVAQQFGIPFHFISVAPESKAQAEARQMEILRSLGIDLVVFARYMQVASSDFVAHYPSRVINIHHSFLPAFVGQKPYHQAHSRGVKIIGATAHYATAALDDGPIISQDVEHVSHRDSVEDLIRRGRDLEKVVLARAMRLHLEDRVLVYGNKTVVFD